MNTDISGVSSVISGTLASVVSNIATVITTLIALFSMSVPLAPVGIAVIPLLVLPTRSAGRTRWKYLTESQTKSDELNQKINKEVTDLNMKEQRSGQLFRVAMGMFTQIGVVTQESYLFNGTILENLRYAKTDATMEEIEEACRIANIHEFISSQPGGSHTRGKGRSYSRAGNT